MGNVERDETVRTLHAQGVSYRAIGERVGLSAMQCSRIAKRGVEPVAADEDDADADDEVDRRYVAKLVKEAFKPDGTLNKASRLYRLLFTVRDGFTLVAVRDGYRAIMVPDYE